MNTRKVLLLLLMALVAGCLDTVQSYDDEFSVDVFSTEKDLPKCSEENEGTHAYVKKDSAARVCVNGKWQFYGTVYTNSVKIENKCTVKNLKDSSGVKIICGGDSVGVVLNGEKGDQGNQGKVGDKGSAGAIGPKGESGDKGEKGDTGPSGNDGSDGTKGDPGASCSVKALADSSGFKILCGEDSVGVILNGKNGSNGKECTVEHLESGDGFKVYCDSDSAGVLLSGRPGISCSLSKSSDGMTAAMLCGGDTVSVISGGNGLGVCSKWREFEVMYLNGMYFLCHDGAWGEASVLEFDTFGFGDAMDGETRVGRVNADIYYVYVEGQWRNSTILEDLGICKVANEKTIGKSNGYYYICKSGLWKLASIEEYDTYGIACGMDASLVAGVVNPSKKYVCDAGKFRAATEMEVFLNKGCTDYTDTSKVVKSGVDYYCDSGEWIAGLRDSRDGRVYRSVIIGNQTWMAENLDYSDSIKTPSLKGRQWCYDNKADSCAKYGRLYTWSAVIDSVQTGCGYGIECMSYSLSDYCNDGNGFCYANVMPVQGICPDGWHVPDESEWKILVDYAGGENARYFLRASVGWRENNYNYDTYGFSALPGGYTWGNGLAFVMSGHYAYFWLAGSTEYSASMVSIGSSVGSVDFSTNDKTDGLSLRCIKNRDDIPNCNSNLEGSLIRVGERAFTCHSSRWILSTDLERDLYGVECTKDGAIVSGVENPATKYVCDADTFRLALEIEVALGKGCTSYDGANRVAISSTGYYCESGNVKMKDARDNKYYKVAAIGSQIWMAENLNYSDSVSTPSLKNRSFCYNNVVDSCAKYGRLYTWSAVMDSAVTQCGYGRDCYVDESLLVQGICPDGWHVPSQNEMYSLFAQKNYSDLISRSNGGETDRYGFGIVYGGYSESQGNSFSGIGYSASFWTRTQGSQATFDEYYEIYPWLNGVYYYASDGWGYDNREKSYSYSLRCLKNGDKPVCTPANAGEVVDLGTQVLYVCRASMWRPATENEMNIRGLTCLHDGTILDGVEDASVKYVCDADTFRHATQLEITLGRGCTSYDTDVTPLSGDDYYCSAGTMKLKDSRDGHFYKVVPIGQRFWMGDNLKYADSVETTSLLGRTTCYPGNSADSCEKYGRYYTYAAAIDSAHLYDSAAVECGGGHSCSFENPVRGVCPVGWHLPSRAEWYEMIYYVNDEGASGEKLKSTSFGGTDDYGFSVIPGLRWDGGTDFSGNFADNAYFVSLYEETETESAYIVFYSIFVGNTIYPKTTGAYIRCVMD